jgi:hypothetical protein
MVTGRADIYRVQSSSLRTGVKEIVTRFEPQGMCLDKGYDYDEVRDLLTESLNLSLFVGGQSGQGT